MTAAGSTHRNEALARELTESDDGVSYLLPPAWRKLGACLGVGNALFFPERGERTEDAKAICAGCAVRTECLEFALDNFEKFGIWGGLSERERRRVRLARRRAAS